MKYIWTTIRFFRAYWAEIRHAANLTVELWKEIMALAPVLAEDLRNEAAEDDQS